MAQAVQGRARRCKRRPKRWADRNAKGRCLCGQSTNLDVLRSKSRCESNSRRTEYEKGESVTYKGRFGNEKNFRKNVVSNIDTWPETTSTSHFIWPFTQFREVWQGHYRGRNMVFSIRPGNKTTELAAENTEFTSTEKKPPHVSWSQVKIMLVCFFDHKGIVHYEFIAQEQTVNQQYYLEVLTRLKESLRRKRQGIWPDKWILRHYNAPAHDALRFCEFCLRSLL